MSEDEDFDSIQQSRNISPPPANREPYSRGEYHLQPAMKIAKISGKSNGYMIFLRERGKKLFFQQWERPYNPKNQDDHDKIGIYWNALPDEEKEKYRQRANLANSDKAEVTRRRHEGNRWRRNLHHQNPNAYFDQKVDHRLELERRQQYARDVNGMQRIPEKETSWTRLPIFDRDVAEKRRKDRLHIKNVITFRSLGKPENPFIENKGGHNYFQIISVFPVTFLCKANFSEVFCYPAEIAITTASLGEGIVDYKTIQVEFDSNLFYGNNKEDYNIDKPTREAYCKCLGIPTDGPRKAMRPEDAHDWVINNINHDYFQLCDYKQYTWVTQGLRTLALIAGFTARKDYEESIAKRLMTLQDFAIELINNVPHEVREDEKYSDADIESAFLNNCLMPKSSDHFCKFHQFKDASDPAKYQCCVSHNARLLHTLNDVCMANGLQGFRRVYSRNIHELCEEREEPVANLPMAPELVKPQYEPEKTESQEVFLNPVGDLNPMSQYFRRDMDVEFCRELLSLYSDSEDELDLPSGPSTSTRPNIQRNVQPAATSAAIRQQTAGFPRVACMNHSNRNTVINSANNEGEASSSSARTDNYGENRNTNEWNNTRETDDEDEQEVFGIGNGFARERRQGETRRAAEQNTYLYPPHPRRRHLQIIDVFNTEDTNDFYNFKAEDDFKYARDNGYHPAIYPRN